ncbi:MAG: hypothetical protein P4L53_23185 [Candidatus Obscuribacterales bacterium]|nr:hypothetical protein [Candidatus Obscuribacterales bacterium]
MLNEITKTEEPAAVQTVLNGSTCFSCGCPPTSDGQDPCIANLPATVHACCGHGDTGTADYPKGVRALIVDPANPVRHKQGYVSLLDGRTLRFPGTVGGKRVRAVVDAVLVGAELPADFIWDDKPSWWTGVKNLAQLSWAAYYHKYAYARWVVQAGGKYPKGYVRDERKHSWTTGLDDAQIRFVLEHQQEIHAECVRKALRAVPA